MSLEKIPEETIEEMKDEFLDDVFNLNNRLTRIVYMKMVAKNANWIFNST